MGTGEYKSPFLTDEERMMKYEDRQKAREEKLRRYLATHPGSQEQLKGFLARYEKGVGARAVPYTASDTKPGDIDRSVFKGGQPTPAPMRRDTTEVTFSGIPEIRRTTLEQRVEAMVKRLQASPPALQEELLKRIQSEYWKEGMPVSGEALKQVAAHYLNRSAPPVQLNRAQRRAEQKGRGKRAAT